MTQAELRALLAEARQRVAEALEFYDALAAGPLPPDLRAGLEEARTQCVELLASTTDEAIASEIEAMDFAGRALTPAERRGLLIRQ